MINNIKIWGAPPPPIGGMTVHISRLSEYLISDGYLVEFFNFSKHYYNSTNVKNISLKFVWYVSQWLNTSNTIHYVISTRSKIRFLAVLLRINPNNKVIIRVGGESLAWSLTKPGLNKLFNIFSIKYCSCFIGVNKEICRLASSIRKESVYLIPGFLPPKIIEERNINLKTYFPASSKKYKYILVSGQIAHKNDNDIYGLWDIIKLLKYIKKRKLNYRILAFLYSVDKEERFKQKMYLDCIKNQNLTNHFAAIINQNSLLVHLKWADLYLRPSYTDGDCNTIRESLYLGVPVVASSCVQRPIGVSTFKAGDIIDLVNKISLSFGKERKTLVINDQHNNYNKFLELLKSIK